MAAIADEGLTAATVQTMTDEALAVSRATVTAETARRANLAAIPAQIAELVAMFLAEGGDPADLEAALSMDGEEEDDSI